MLSDAFIALKSPAAAAAAKEARLEV